MRRAFAAHEIVPLKGDWTRQDPEITALLQKFGRSGVPLYLLYDRGGTPGRAAADPDRGDDPRRDRPDLTRRRRKARAALFRPTPLA